MKVYKPNVLLPFAFGIILISVIWNTSNPYQVRNTFALAEKQLPTTTITDNDIPFSLPLVGLDNNGTVGRTTPVASAGPDQIVNEGTSVTLNGTASKDPDGNITSYSWRQIVGNSIELSEENTATTTFVAPHVLKNNTLLTFELKVTDNDNASDINTVNIMIKVVEHPIIANAGQDQEVSEGKEVTLDGSSSYSNGTITSYLWKQIDGKPVKLKDAHAAKLTFKAPKVHKDSTLKFRLTVNNDEGKSNTDIVKVVVKK